MFFVFFTYIIWVNINIKNLKTKQKHEGCLHHYVQLFYLWFPPNIISILLHTMHVIKVQWINFKDKKSKKNKKKTGCDFDHKEGHWLRYCMYNTISFIYCKGYWWCHQQRCHGNCMCWKNKFILEALRSGEFYCMVVCMWEGKGTYLGTLLRSTTIWFVNMFYVCSPNVENSSCCWTFLRSEFQ